MTPCALVFGATGAIGSAVAESLAADSFEVHRVSRCAYGSGFLAVDPISDPDGWEAGAEQLPELDVVVWAQGTNRNDSIQTFDRAAFETVMAANCTYVAVTLASLVRHGRIRSRGRLCVVSSVWQMIARPEKLSYSVSKAALGGFVRAAAADLAAHDIVINAVLPGVLDTPMTRAMLDDAQLSIVEGATGFGRLPDLSELVSVVRALCAADNTGMTGQSVSVDLGFTSTRYV